MKTNENENISFINYVFRIQLPDCSKLDKSGKWQWCHNFPKWHHHQLFLSSFVSFVKFSYWSNFKSISSLVLEWRQFSFIRDWPEIWKLEIPTTEFCPISGGCGESGIRNLAQMSNKMLRNAAKCQGNSFYHFWVIKGKLEQLRSNISYLFLTLL